MMIGLRASVSALSISACLGLAACGGGGGGGTGTAVASPPAPVVNPTTFTVRSPDSALLTFQSGAQAAAMIPRPASSNLTVTITDRNAASTVGAINYNGGQSITVHYDETGPSGFKYDHTFAASEFSAGTIAYNGPGGSRVFAVSNWKSPVLAGQDTHDYVIYRLLESGKYTDYVQLGEWRTQVAAAGVNQISAFHLLGTATDAAAMPRTGTAVFSGSAAGKYYASGTGANYAGDNFTALARVSVDFSRTTNAVSTLVNLPSYQSGSGPAFTLSTSGNLSGAQFNGTGSARAPAGR